MQDAPSPTSVDFSAAVAVTGGDRRYKGVVQPSWAGPFFPHGGILGAIALRAIAAEFDDPALQPRSLTCHYLRAPSDGEVVVDVDPLRRGRRFASARATMSQGGKPCLAVLATLSNEVAAADAWEAPAPAGVKPAPPRDAPLIDAGELSLESEGWMAPRDFGPKYFDRVLVSPRFGSAPFSGTPVDPQTGGENGGWVQLSQPRPIDHAWLAFLVDVLWPTALQPLTAPAMSPTLDLTTHFRRALPAGGLPDQPLLVRNTTRGVIEGLAEQDSLVFTADGELLVQARQLLMLSPLES